MACPLKTGNCPFGRGVKECSQPSQYALKTPAPLLGNVKMETTHFIKMETTHFKKRLPLVYQTQPHKLFIYADGGKQPLMRPGYYYMKGTRTKVKQYMVYQVCNPNPKSIILYVNQIK